MIISTICHYLGLGRKTIVCAVCLFMNCMICGLVGLLRDPFVSWCFFVLFFYPEFGTLSLTCSINTLLGTLVTIDTSQICFHGYVIPMLCVWECCIIILLAHGQDQTLVFAHPQTNLPFKPREDTIHEGVERYPAPYLGWARRESLHWLRFLRYYPSKGFWVSWILFPRILHSMICAIGRIHNDLKVVLCCMHTTPSHFQHDAGWQ